MRSNLDKQLDTLNQEMIRMGMLCETAISMSSDAVLRHDAAEAKKLPDLLEQIHDKDKQIESVCLMIILQQQPVASDLRLVSSALKMVTDMDRIGVQSNDIAEIVTMKGIEGPIDRSIPVREMADAVIHMVTAAVDAFVKRDDNMAHSVVKYDDKVDSCFDRVKEKLAEVLKRTDNVTGRDPETGLDAVAVLDILMITKYLERIGDHAVNIARWVIFSITGIDEKHEGRIK